MTVRTAPMFDKPGEQPLQLSKALATYENRLTKGEKAKWTDIKVKSPRPCQECAAVQHETRGAFGPRRQAKRRRKHPFGPQLELCTGHAQLWQRRDEQDSAAKKAVAS